jgi:hypothetical protein
MCAVALFGLASVGCDDGEESSPLVDAGSPSSAADGATSAAGDGATSNGDAIDRSACVPDESAPPASDRCTTDPANTSLPACGTWLKVEPQGAQCSNGSQYKFFVNYSNKSNNVVVMFEPGGACWDFESCSGRARGAANPNGITDTHMEKYQFLNLLRRDPQNPVEDWSMVFVSYCTGDVHTGRKVATYADPQGGPALTYRHVGHDNTLKMVDWVKDHFRKIPKLLVTGCSAGGIAALQNYLYIREGLDAQCGYLLNDSGPAFHSDGPSRQQHEQVSGAWGVDSLLDELGGKLPIDIARLKQDFGLVNVAIADKYPHDRLGLTVYEKDLNYSLYAYERFFPGSTEAQIHERWSEELTHLLRTYDSRSNLAYYVPHFRPDNCSHCVSIPPLDRDTATILSTPWLGTEIEQSNLTLRTFTDVLLDPARPLLSYREAPQPNEAFTPEQSAKCMKPN